MIRVLDEQRSIQFYEKAFGLKTADRLDFEKFTLVYLSNDASEFELELTVNKDRSLTARRALQVIVATPGWHNVRDIEMGGKTDERFKEPEGAVA